MNNHAAWWLRWKKLKYIIKKIIYNTYQKIILISKFNLSNKVLTIILY
jgi:hypothetical protein